MKAAPDVNVEWYRRWLWWSRLGITMTFLQVMSTAYLTLILGRNLSTQSNHVSFCSVDGRNEQRWLVALMVGLPTLGSIIVFAQCCVGSDVLAWRLLYGAHYGAWRAHYRQMFDYGIREVLCCLGRRRYMSVLEEDEVDSVAALLGDLVAYRAVGASHLEVIAGVALLRESAPAEDANENLLPAPDPLIREATVLHPYAVAAYTGPLLDVGRNPFTFPCAWLYRQGVLTPWKRNRMPKLEGDNWWRGHAAAFLRFAQIPPEALRKGRVLQTKRESVYFVVVLHHLRYVVVAVRGTETPEDLLTDGLGRESALMDSDLCGILKNNTVSDRVKQDVQATMPHFGHIGVIEAARELALELDNLPDADDEENAQNGSSTSNDCNKNNNRSTAGGCQASLLTEKKGLLTSLLGPGGECQGYSLRIVGHSLGGAIAALTGLRLANRYPSLHVYTFGVLPCVDLVTAEACSSFTTSIIYNDEFSSRLSVAAIMRLRAAALQALATDANTDSALVTKLTKRLFTSSSSKDTQSGKSEHSQRRRRRVAHALKGSENYDEDEAEDLVECSGTGRLERDVAVDGSGDARSTMELLDNGMPKHLVGLGPGVDLQEMWPAEMYVPGLVLHLVRNTGNSSWSALRRSFTFARNPDLPKRPKHKAYLKDRKQFRDILVSPAMFLDHMPWKCQYALNDILEQLNAERQRQAVSSPGSSVV
ncbi:sn1-specific diacylglycerol lipase [Marchantia polymorpha subsp. ruderalis]|uniref:Fungal lipase-like domain-containing protein n=2 Tax=Marchantia polymorpha TaxID=3197 RepID=A0AAF6C0B5_MARPO|nr:hypothetical protein MARPO_0123s0015 [Marchantia polymorpha]BBN17699.1 hypothetical protein Mp_7g16330 [Marchantia polymorpha subsp. ruderalis]|eukprot:PTQ30521.1 hypothetical protein MARPO_0123s0015 [Marchantia polymorpha]